MRLMIVAVLGLALNAIPVVAFAGYFVTGNELYSLCKEGERWVDGDNNVKNGAQKAATCSGYVVAASDLLSATSETFDKCAPSSITRGQVTDMVMKYLSDHPESRQLNGATLVATALQEGFCK